MFDIRARVENLQWWICLILENSFPKIEDLYFESLSISEQASNAPGQFHWCFQRIFFTQSWLWVHHEYRVSTSALTEVWKGQSSPEYQFRNLSIRAQHPPVSEQNTRIPNMIQHKSKDIFVDQQNTNAEWNFNQQRSYWSAPARSFFHLLPSHPTQDGHVSCDKFIFTEGVPIYQNIVAAVCNMHNRLRFSMVNYLQI